MSPTFTVRPSDLFQTGPVVELSIGISSLLEDQLKKEGKPIPPPIKVKAMIDTGATVTAISDKLAKTLQLEPIGVQTINTPSSQNVECGVYHVRLYFPENIGLESNVLGAPLKGQDIACLIGRNVLAHSVLVYIGRENQFTLSF